MRAVAAALLCSLVLASHTHGGFDRQRFRVITDPVIAGEPSLTVSLPDLAPLAGNPAALVLRIAAGPSPVRLSVRFDDNEVAGALVAAGDERRLDASAQIPAAASGAGHAITITGDAPGWRLTYLEVANVHGFSNTWLRFVIVPQGYAVKEMPASWMTVIAGMLLLALGLQQRPPVSRWGRRAWLTGSAIVVLLFAAVLAISRTTPFFVLMTWGSFAACAAVLYAPTFVSLAARVFTANRMRFIRRAAPYMPHIVAAWMVLWGVAQHYDPQTGFTHLIVFGSEFSPRTVQALKDIPHATDTSSGYDGQFYAQLAFDPLMLRPGTAEAMDATAYRARRLLMPATAFLLGGGYPPLIIQVYALLNVACWLLLGWLLALYVPPDSPSRVAIWIACMLSHGMLASVRLSLTDGPSMLLLALAGAAVRDHRPWAASGVLALAGLTRETSLLSVLGLPLPAWNQRDVTTWLTRIAVAAMPVVLWMLMLWARGFTDEGGVRNFAWPLTAYFGKWASTIAQVSASPPDPYAWYSLCALVALPVQALTLIAIWRTSWRDFWWKTGVAYILLLAVLGPAVWEGNPGAITRAVLPMTFAFNLLLPRGPAFWPLWLLGNLNLAHSLTDLGLRLF